MSANDSNTPRPAGKSHRRWRFFLVISLTVVLVAAAVCWPWWQAFHRLNNVRKLLGRGDLEAAERACESLETVYPGRAELAYLLAVVHRRLGRMELFEEHLRRAARLGWPEEAIQRQRWLATAQSGNVEAVEDLLTAVIDRGVPDDEAEEIYEALAKGHLAAFRLREAWNCLDYWLHWRPDAPQGRLMRAEVYERRDRLPQAVEDYRAVVDRLPAHRVARLKLAQGLVKLQRFNEAQEHFEKLLDADNEDAEALLGMAQCSRLAGESAAAEGYLQAALRQPLAPPLKAKTLAELGQLRLGEGQSRKAVEALTQAVSLAPSESTTQYALARALVMDGRPELAHFHHRRVEQIREQYERLAETTSRLIDEPDNADLRFQAGTILIEQGFPQEGLSWLQTALACDPHHGPTQRFLEGRQRFKQGLEAFAINDLSALPDIVESLSQLDGFASHAHLLQGMLLLRQGRLRESLDEFGDARAHPETQVVAFTLSGEALYKMKQFRDAERVLSTAILLDHGQTDAHRWLAAIYHDIGAVDYALAELTTVAEQAPADPRPHRLMGLIYKDFEAYVKAIEAYRESLRRASDQPDRQQILVELAACLIEQRLFDEALTTLVDCAPTAEVKTLQAHGHRGAGDTALARRRLTEALETEPDRVETLQLLATLETEADEIPAAVETLQRAVAIDPQHWRLRYQLAQAYQRSGQRESAEQQLQVMKQLQAQWEHFTELHKKAMADPDDAQLRYELGVVARQLNQPALAVTWFTAALSMDPDRDDARQALKELLPTSNQASAPD